MLVVDLVSQQKPARNILAVEKVFVQLELFFFQKDDVDKKKNYY